MDAVLSDTLKANLKSAKDTPGKIAANYAIDKARFKLP